MAFNSSKHSTEKVSGTSWHGFHWLGLDFYLMHQLKIIYLIIKSPNLQYVIYWHFLADSLSYQHMETPSLLKLLKSFYNRGFSAIFSDTAVVLAPQKVLNFSVIDLHIKFQPQETIISWYILIYIFLGNVLEYVYPIVWNLCSSGWICYLPKTM